MTNTLIKAETINVKELVSKDTKLSITLQTKMVEKLKQHFSEEEQRWYIANLYMYMNYHPTNDYPIHLTDVYSLIGFANKANAKRTLQNHFTIDQDYKVLLIRKDEQKNDQRGGHNNENIILNIDTFKTLCMLTKTDKGKEIRKYYVKLENIYNELIKEELEEHKKALDEKTKELEEKELELIESNDKINRLLNKPSLEGFKQEFGYIYIVMDTSAHGVYKIGYTVNPKPRLSQLNMSSFNKTLAFYKLFKTPIVKQCENIIHAFLHQLKIISRNEWFYFETDDIMQYAIKTIEFVIDQCKQFAFVSFEQLKQYTSNLPPLKDQIEPMSDEDIDNFVKIQHTITNNKINQVNNDKFCGVFLDKRSGKYQVKLQQNYTNINLGYYSTELKGAQVYNDYALFLNNTSNGNYQINKLDNYYPNPRDIPKELLDKNLQTKTSKWKGVTFHSRDKLFITTVQFKNKNYKIFKHDNDLECAKIYNQQILYLNETYKTNYIPNDIPNYTDIMKNHIFNFNDDNTTHLPITISYRSDTKTWKLLVKHNSKNIHLGNFETKSEAIMSYNDYILFLNNTTNTSYVISQIDDYIPNPRDIVKELSEKTCKTSNFTGVDFHLNIQKFFSVICYNRKKYVIAYDSTDIECAKLYNKQALFLNNHFNTSYILNDIPDYITFEQDFLNLTNESNQYFGVYYKRDSNTYRAFIKQNKIVTNLGYFKTAEQAATAYNNKAIELNKLDSTIVKYKLNILM